MAAKLVKTNIPGIYRRHAAGCARGGRCDCPYVIVWRPAASSTPTRSGRSRRRVKRREIGTPATVDLWSGPARGLLPGLDRVLRGPHGARIAEKSRALYRRAIELYALREWASWRLAEVEPADVRGRFAQLRDDGISTSELRLLRAALSAMFATAVEDGLLRSNPVQGVRIPSGRSSEPSEQERAKALTRTELARVLAALPEGWRLFFEFLTHTGLRISEAIGLTWASIDLGRDPRVRVREQVYEGERQPLKSSHSRRDIPLSARMAERLRALRRDSYRGEMVHPCCDNHRNGAKPLERVKPCAQASRAERRAAVGDFSQLTPHVRVASVRRRQEHQAGAGVARARGPSVHAADLCPSDGRGTRRCRVHGRRGERRSDAGQQRVNTRSGNRRQSGDRRRRHNRRFGGKS